MSLEIPQRNLKSKPGILDRKPPYESLQKQNAILRSQNAALQVQLTTALKRNNSSFISLATLIAMTGAMGVGYLTGNPAPLKSIFCMAMLPEFVNKMTPEFITQAFSKLRKVC